MSITVMYTNGKAGIVESYQLDDLIASGKIKKFRRSDGWVVVGKDPIRKADELEIKPKKRQSAGNTR
jgi:hypothetical protein